MQKLSRNQKAISCVGAFALIFVILTQALPTPATEVSGRIIKELVEEVDKEMTRLEDRVEGFSQKSEDLSHGLQENYNSLKATNNEMTKQKILADMLVICAKLNEQDLQEITVYKETLTALVPKMERLQGEISKMGNMGFKHKEGFIRFRHRMGNVLTNSVRILKKLRQVTDDERLKQEFIPIESTLVGIYKMFQSPLRPDPVSYNQVTTSIRSMEDTFAQLTCVQKLLEQERVRLQVDNLNQLSRLALTRLFKGRLSINNVSEIPGKITDSVLHRTQIYTKAASISYNGKSDATGAWNHSSSTENILNEIGAGNLFK